MGLLRKKWVNIPFVTDISSRWDFDFSENSLVETAYR